MSHTNVYIQGSVTSLHIQDRRTSGYIQKRDTLLDMYRGDASMYIVVPHIELPTYTRMDTYWIASMETHLLDTYMGNTPVYILRRHTSGYTQGSPFRDTYSGDPSGLIQGTPMDTYQGDTPMYIYRCEYSGDIHGTRAESYRGDESMDAYSGNGPQEERYLVIHTGETHLVKYIQGRRTSWYI